VSSKDVEIHEIVEEVSMKSPIEIKNFKPMVNINILP
jgi:hypothetical protein